MSQIRTSIVIPTWQRAAFLETCLKAILGQVVRPDEIIVVGREQDADARDVVDHFKGSPTIRWVSVTTPGHIAPVIEGLNQSRGNLVAFLDDDTEPEPEWLAVTLPQFGDPTVACVGGRVETQAFPGKVPSDAGRIRWYGKHVGNIGALEVDAPVEVHAVMECSWMWRRDVLKDLVFEPVFFEDDASMYGLDLCLQAKQRGYRILYQPSAIVFHHVAPRDRSLDRAQRPERTLAYSRNYTFTAMRHLRGFRLFAFRVWWWLIGERGSYGVATAVYDLLARGPRNIMPLVRASWRGKGEGLQAWKAARR